MKKTIRINIAGFIFNIDEDAYEKLSIYLDKINLHFSNSDEGKEIISDIELRIAEIFQTKISPEKEVITILDVEDVIKILGNPEQIADVDEEPVINETKGTQFRSKPFYRNPDDRLLGGVCSGLAAYFGIDPLIVRIIFIIATVVYGTGSLIYIILWIVVPEAKTTAQKLEMRGETVNVNNIEKSIKQEFYNVKNNFNTWRNSSGYTKTRHSIDQFVQFLLAVLRVSAKILVAFIAIIFLFTGIVSIGAISLALFSDVSIVADHDFPVNSLSIYSILNVFLTPKQGILAFIGIILITLIPFIFISYLGAKLLFKFKTDDKIYIFSMIILFIIGIFLTVFAGLNTARNFKVNDDYEKEYIIETKNDTIYINNQPENEYLASLKIDDYEEMNFDKFKIYTNQKNVIFLNRPEFNIQKSDDDKIKLVVNYKAHGKTRKEAQNSNKSLNYNWLQIDSILKFDPYLMISGSENWRAQEVFITLYLPKGKTIIMNNDMKYITNSIQNVQNVWDNNMPGKYWHMTELGLSTELNPVQNSDTTKVNNSSNNLNEMKQELENLHD